jgi:hypothetical protein
MLSFESHPDFDDPHFLEPAHYHDPQHALHITTLPLSVTEQMPKSFLDAVSLLEESTSIAYSSFTRLQCLVEERFDYLLAAERTGTEAAEHGKNSCKVKSEARAT